MSGHDHTTGHGEIRPDRPADSGFEQPPAGAGASAGGSFERDHLGAGHGEASWLAGRAPIPVVRPVGGEPTVAAKPPRRGRRLFRTRFRTSGAAQLAAAAFIALAGMFVGIAVMSGANPSGSQDPAVGLRPADSAELAQSPGSGGDAGSAGPIDAAADTGAGNTDGEPSSRLVEDHDDEAELAEALAQPLDAEAIEPVVAVARRVLPSVVAITTEFGNGSGIVWDADKGYIVTNHHVLHVQAPSSGVDLADMELVDTAEVTLADGSRLEARVIGGSGIHDVAVLQVSRGDIQLVEAEFAATSTVQVGQLAVAVGSPFGLEGTVTAGIVSSVRIIDDDPSPTGFLPVRTIQTDAPINPGNSGGALADRYGRVVGMNRLIRTSGLSQGNIGIGFAIPSDTIELIAERVIAGESLEIGYMGITSSSTAGPTSVGVEIAEVIDGSPAHIAGLQSGDVILSIQGVSVSDITELSAAVKLYRPGDRIELLVSRGNDSFVATLVLAAFPDN